MKSRSQDEVRVRKQGSPSLPWSGVLPRAAAGLGQLRDGSLNSVPGPDNSLKVTKDRTEASLPDTCLGHSEWVGLWDPETVQATKLSTSTGPTGSL